MKALSRPSGSASGTKQTLGLSRRSFPETRSSLHAGGRGRRPVVLSSIGLDSPVHSHFRSSVLSTTQIAVHFSSGFTVPFFLGRRRNSINSLKINGSCSTGVSWELLRNAESQALPQTCQSRMCAVTRHPAHSDSCTP